MKCGATGRAPTGNEQAKARTVEGEAPLLAHILRAGQQFTCTKPAGHEGAHREDYGGLAGIEWGGPEIPSTPLSIDRKKADSVPL